MIPLSIAPDLMEEAVLLAERQATPGVARAFRRERDRIYDVVEPEVREAQFQRLALEWFDRFGLRPRMEAALTEWPALEGHVAAGRLVGAIGPAAEGADLVDGAAAHERTESRPLLVLRLMPQSLLDDATLWALLRHELMHITDILDAAFGYDRTLPSSHEGPSADNMLRDRYRVVWDVTIDGRLARAGRGQLRTRDTRWREFRMAYAMLADACPGAFEQWWNQSHPTHAELVAFAMAPPGAPAGRGAGRCPFCRFPVASLDARVSTLAEPVVRALVAEHPSWRPEQGICTQCFDLYEARYGYAGVVRR